MNEIIKRIEAEIEGTRKAFRDHPDRYSTYGEAYWDGNIAGLQWVLSIIREVRGSASKEVEAR